MPPQYPRTIKPTNTTDEAVSNKTIISKGATLNYLSFAIAIKAIFSQTHTVCGAVCTGYLSQLETVKVLARQVAGESTNNLVNRPHVGHSEPMDMVTYLMP
jgi:hypothetical protein